MDRLVTLESNVSRQIEAGSVISGISEIVEELVKNSIDAGSMRIEVEFRPAEFLVSVADDGGGISNEGLGMIGKPCRTSKARGPVLRSFGMSLHRIASLCSELVVVSRIGEEFQTRKCQIRPNRENRITVATEGRQRGTTVSCHGIFHQMPVRRTQLRQTSDRVSSRVVRVIQRYSMANRKIGFHLKNGATTLYMRRSSTSSSPSQQKFMRDHFHEMLGRAGTTRPLPIEDLLRLSVSEGPFICNGWISQTRVHRSREYQWISVNKTIIPPNHPLPNSAARAYPIPPPKWLRGVGGMLYPAFFLNVLTNQQESSNRTDLGEFIRKTVKETLTRERREFEEAFREKMGFHEMHSEAAPRGRTNVQVMPKRSISVPRRRRTYSRDSGAIQVKDLIQRTIDTRRTAPQSRTEPGIPPVAKVTVSKSLIHGMEVINQLDRKFILTKSNRTLFAIDQHAADERVRLEQFENDVYSGNGNGPNPTSIHLAKTRLDVPQVIRCSQANGDYIKANSRTLETWYWTIEPKKSESYSSMITAGLLESKAEFFLRSHPTLCGKALLEKELFSFVAELKQGRLGRPACFQKVLASKACRGAIMFGDVLTIRQCRVLLQKLSLCRLPFQCAHGRPSIQPLLKY